VCLYTLLWIVLYGSAVLPADGKKAAEGLPKPQEVELKTDDKVTLTATYYESNEGEKAVPVVVIHDWKEEGSVYEPLAKYLQNKGYAVIVPDLRGHGGSTKQTTKQANRVLKPENVNAKDIWARDLEAIRMFLLKENDEKKLNLSATCLIGVGTGAILATYYAIWDWDPYFRYPSPHKNIDGKRRLHVLSRGGKQDIKALVLVSPAKKLDNWSIDSLWKYPNLPRQFPGELSILILVGEKEKPTKESKTAKNLYTRLKKFHPNEGTDVGKWSLFFKTLDTELNGQRLVNETDLHLGGRADIRSFLNLRLRDRLRTPDFEWKERPLPQ